MQTWKTIKQCATPNGDLNKVDIIPPDFLCFLMKTMWNENYSFDDDDIKNAVYASFIVDSQFVTPRPNRRHGPG